MSLDKENEMENKSPLEKNKTYEILFIGNSYTYYNSTVPEEFRKIALSAGYTVNVDSVTKGSYFLSHSVLTIQRGIRYGAQLIKRYRVR